MRLTNTEIEQLLSTYFPLLQKKEIDIFLSICSYQAAKNKEIIFKGGKTNKNLIFILKGVAKASSINAKGQELNNFIRAEGYLMGDARVFGDEVQELTIEAISEIHVLKFNISKLEALGFENKKLMEFYLDFLKEIILTLSYRLNTFITMTPEERYLDLVAWNPILLETAFDKDIASFLGITPLTLHRIKKKQKTIK